MGKPIVAIVGRQNVGKSTLMNRIAGRRLAIVEDYAGTTRDRVITEVTWNGVTFDVVDTGGLEIRADGSLAQAVKGQAETAIADADAIVFVADVHDGVVPIDLEIADILRRTDKPVILVANKADRNQHVAAAVDFWEFSLGEPIPVSGHHGRGAAEMLDAVAAALPAAPETPVVTDTSGLKIAIVGRPNVGKSMLVNRLLGIDRSIVSEIPGTTRDAIDTNLKYRGQDLLLIDTAGIRRRGKQKGIERYSVMRSMRAIERCDVAVLVLDATDPTTAQDLHVAGLIQQALKGVIIVVNKWDLVANSTAAEYTMYIMNEIKFMPYAALLYTSALSGKGVKKILPEALRVHQQRQIRLPTAAVNNVVQAAVGAHTLIRRGKRLNVLYTTQAETDPPTFVFFVNDARLVHFSYQRFLENKLREAFGFVGTPLRLVFKSRGEA